MKATALVLAIVLSGATAAVSSNKLVQRAAIAVTVLLALAAVSGVLG